MRKTNKKGLLLGLGIVVGIIVLFSIFFVGRYNKLVSKQEAVNESFSQVENQYQRRLDLIPNLVETVKGYASHEKETLEGVIEARAKATQTKISAKDMNAEKLAEFNQSQQELSNALGKLMVVVERYPELKANENFMQLQAQLEGTENRIAIARRDFNNTAKMYNVYLRSFPNNIVGGIMNFKKRPYFESDEKAKSAPQVKF